MSANRKTPAILQDAKIPTKIKLSALWIVLMFLFIYVDHFSLFIPGVIENAIAGEVGGFQVTQVWLVTAMILMVVPSLMIFLSLALPAKVNRWVNIIAGIVYVVVVVGNTIGETWVFYIFASVIEVVLLLLIVVFAWKWPRQEA
jgi:hypothetical protein